MQLTWKLLLLLLLGCYLLHHYYPTTTSVTFISCFFLSLRKQASIPSQPVSIYLYLFPSFPCIHPLSSNVLSLCPSGVYACSVFLATKTFRCLRSLWFLCPLLIGRMLSVLSSFATNFPDDFFFRSKHSSNNTLTGLLSYSPRSHFHALLIILSFPSPFLHFFVCFSEDTLFFILTFSSSLHLPTGDNCNLWESLSDPLHTSFVFFLLFRFFLVSSSVAVLCLL